MLNHEERAAWQDAFHEAQRAISSAEDDRRGWYGTVGFVAAGLVAIWALYTWLPPS